ncbi:hypothetical protein [Pseudomonas putida]|uniref:hypothetical protein n=1 Tax=Pseudomonas putida TaxID=303 RepID=UPI003D33A0CD
MNRKEPFNDAAQGKESKDDARKKQIAEWERDCARDVEMREEEQRRRDDKNMEKALRRVLLAHNRPSLRPDGVRPKPLTASQAHEQARRDVDAQNLRELNAIRNAHRQRVAAFENEVARPDRENQERPASPKTIRTIFNGLPGGRDGREHERDR